ncbi:MAG: 3-hydroxyacyl-ACP dehydratase FabZ family protein [Planctomycetota bacterium]|jgi:3-hydroxyacyl-[acyl-carrier-protein] dehydratase
MAYVFVDKILECEPGRRVVAVKALAFNEEFFRDHFPGMPVLPGAMILEGFVQAARHCLAGGEGEHDRWVLHAVENMRFNRFATPGEVVHLEADRDGGDDEAVWFKGRAKVEDRGVCRLRFAVRKQDDGRD